MNINITFRHIESTDALKNHASQKVSRLQKYLRQPMTARITLAAEKAEQLVEAKIQSGGHWFEAHEAGDEMYAVIDNVVSKLESQIQHAKGVSQAKRRKDVDLRHQPAPEEFSASIG
ncbi:MAG: ribosome-associated translation inhibitor RaiA [Polyangiaceae bacterium]|nr:ribosome-associated translation inhibitor RaiA [Polyangiaceae bacterium]